MRKILIIGPQVLDIASYVDRLPKGDEEFLPISTSERLSGLGYTALKLSESLGVNYHLCTTVGTGVYGEKILDTMPVLNKYQSERFTHGCTYTLIDRMGNTNAFMVPGGEYTFQKDWVSAIDPTTISFVFVSATMLVQEGRDELINFLSQFDSRIILRTDMYSCLSGSDAIKRVMKYHPIISCTAQEAWILTDQKYDELSAIAEVLFNRNQAPLILHTDDDQVYYFDDEHEFVAEIPHNRIIDRSGADDALAAGFAIARSSGISVSSALSFSADCYEKTAILMETAPDQNGFDALLNSYKSKLME